MAWELAENIRGPKGDKGDRGTISSVSVATLPPDAPAEATLTGTADVHVHFGIPKGEKGDRGPAGVASSASAESVPAGEQAAIVLSQEGELVHAHFKVPRGLPGVNAVENDTAVSEYVTAADSDTKAALNGLYPVRRVWDGSAYPPRIAGAVNLFIGPIDPGLLMHPEDLWADPNFVTLDDVTAAMSTPGTALRTVTQSFVTPERVYIPASGFSAVDGRAAGAFQAFSTANVSAGGSGWFFPKATQPYVSSQVRIPDGWSRADLRLYFSHTTATPDGVTVWRVRVQPFTVGGDLQGTPSGMSFVRNYTPIAPRVIDASGYFQTEVTPANTPDSRLYTIVINRQTADPADTTTHPVAVIGAELRRLS